MVYWTWLAAGISFQVAAATHLQLLYIIISNTNGVLDFIGCGDILPGSCSTTFTIIIISNTNAVLMFYYSISLGLCPPVPRSVANLSLILQNIDPGFFLYYSFFEAAALFSVGSGFFKQL